MNMKKFTKEDLKWLEEHKAKKLTDCYGGQVSYEIKVSRLLLTVGIFDGRYRCDINQNQLYCCPRSERDTMLAAIKSCIQMFHEDVHKVNRSNDQLMKKVADLFGVEEKKQ